MGWHQFTSTISLVPILFSDLSDQLVVTDPRSQTKSKGDQASYIASPRLWNSLLITVRSLTSITTFKSWLRLGHTFCVPCPWITADLYRSCGCASVQFILLLILHSSLNQRTSLHNLSKFWYLENAQSICMVTNFGLRMDPRGHGRMMTCMSHGPLRNYE